MHLVAWSIVSLIFMGLVCHATNVDYNRWAKETLERKLIEGDPDWAERFLLFGYYQGEQPERDLIDSKIIRETMGVFGAILSYNQEFLPMYVTDGLFRYVADLPIFLTEYAERLQDSIGQCRKRTQEVEWIEMPFPPTFIDYIVVHRIIRKTPFFEFRNLCPELYTAFEESAILQVIVALAIHRHVSIVEVPSEDLSLLLHASTFVQFYTALQKIEEIYVAR